MPRPTVARRRLALAISVTLALPLVTVGAAGAHDAEDHPQIVRVAGDDRYATAIAVSQRVFQGAAADAVDTVVLARGDVYADALTGGPLAAAVGGPLLLTRSNALPDGVLAEIQRLGATEVILLGGPVAISPDVAAELTGAGLNVSRLEGQDRFETAAAIAAELVGTDDVAIAFVVEGIDENPLRGWPDAVSVGAYASFLGAPVLPVATDTVPQATLDALAALDPDEVVIVGGPAAVSEAVEQALDALYDVRRIAGDDRYATASGVYAEAIVQGMDASPRWVASGENFPDALTAGPAAGVFDNPLMLVPGTNLTTFTASTEILRSTPDLVDRVLLVGGEAAITPAVRDVIASGFAPPAEAAPFCLTILHNNDGESQLVDAGSGLEDFGGAARFATRVLQEQAAARENTPSCDTSGVLTVTSGDNFLAGPEFNASLANQDDGGVFYDSILYQYLPYDAIDLGNHDFDFGPGVTADFIGGVFDPDNPAAAEGNEPVFLSANLDFSGEPGLQAQVDLGNLDGSTVVDVCGTVEAGAWCRQVGVIGLTTPTLRSISSPGDVVVNGRDPDGSVDNEALAAIIDAEIASMPDVDVIVLISHLQGIDGDLELIAELSGVDVVVAGGGDEILGSPGDPFVPGDAEELFDAYPILATDADGMQVPVVTTAGSYKYVGRLDTRFDDDGNLLGVDPSSRMVRVAGGSTFDAVMPDAFVQANVVDPVEAFLADLATEVVATSEVDLDGRRSSVRTQETNEGNLLADALRVAAEANAADFGLDDTATFVAVQNGGGIRNDTVLAAGDLTLLDTFDIAPFSNFVSVFEDVDMDELDALLEHAYTDAPSSAGKFAQLSNLVVDVDVDGPAGDRVTIVSAGGVAVTPDTTVSLVTIDFLARGGDDYPTDGLGEFTSVGVSYQQALADHLAALQAAAGEGNPGVTAADYPEISTEGDPPAGNAGRIRYVAG